MCRADTSIIPFEFRDVTRLPSPKFENVHQCVNWNKFTDWLDTRVVDVFAPGMVIHPKYGTLGLFSFCEI
jgi:hypothetical protein